MCSKEAALAAPPLHAEVWEPSAVLNEMRNRAGEPNVAVRGLALLLVLLLAGPLTYWLVRAAARALDLAL